MSQSCVMCLSTVVTRRVSHVLYKELSCRRDEGWQNDGESAGSTGQFWRCGAWWAGGEHRLHPNFCMRAVRASYLDVTDVFGFERPSERAPWLWTSP